MFSYTTDIFFALLIIMTVVKRLVKYRKTLLFSVKIQKTDAKPSIGKLPKQN